MEIALERLDEILLEHNFDGSSLIAILQKVQGEAGYLPAYALKHLAENLDVSESRILALSTFYKSFSLVPTGKHKIGICMGTACHIRGGQQILEKLERDLGIKTDETTPDKNFSLESVRCLGCCSLAPVARVGEKVYGRLDQRKVSRVLKEYS